jgi:peptidoglycan/xylan/chitin deacetylase (PgdA/CDA1 family)
MIMRAYGVMFHHFHGGDHARSQGSMSAAELADMIDHLGRERVLPAREWMARAEGETLGDTDLCLTFDDNLRCQYDVALPVLADLGLTAFWFVATGVLEGRLERLEIYRRFRETRFAEMQAFYGAFFGALDASPYGEETRRALAGVDTDRHLAEYPFYTPADRRFRYVRDEVLGPARYEAIMDALIAASGETLDGLASGLWMDEACLRRLHGEGHVIGLHSHTHPTRIDRLSADEQRGEYELNRSCLRRLLGESPRSMSHPCNAYNETTLGILRQIGVTVGFRANMARPTTGVFEYPREDHANILREMKGAPA